jgi:C_GCAxxG_C_C family probable redox protein
MADYSALESKLRELEAREWDIPAIENRCRHLAANGIPGKTLSRNEVLDTREVILSRVQRRGEEYNFILKNCAKSTALAIMEEFGLGNMEIVKALSPFPGFGGTGWMCGGVTGGLIALGLHGGSDDLLNNDAVRATIMAARQFMSRFEKETGAVTCPKIQEDIVFGRYMDPAASPENMQAFDQANGFKKCSLFPGIGARIAAEIIIEAITQ